MFHLALTCPHCGAPRVAAAPVPGPGLTLSGEEARALLQVTAGAARPASLGDVAAEVVLPRGGWAELLLCVLAAPVTVLTVVVLGYLLVRQRRSRREEQLQGIRALAVPACTLLAAAMLAGGGLPWAAWAVLGAAFLAWGLREVLRRRRVAPPLG
jgi:hypothetical protein